MAIEQFLPGDTRAGDFLALGQRLYAHDGRAVAEGGEFLREQLGVSKARAAAARAHFLGRVQGRVAARVSAFVNDALRDDDGSAVGALGFFEAENEPALVADLLGCARRWLRDAHGISRAWGPINFDIWHGYRCMTRGFDVEPFAGEPYNKSYYPMLLEASGATVRHVWHSFEDGGAEQPAAIHRRGLGRLAELRAAGYRFAPFDARRLESELLKLHKLLCAAFRRFPAFTPIAERDFLCVTAPLAAALVPGGAWFLHEPDGAPCGFAIALLDLGEALRASQRQGTLRAGAGAIAERAASRILFHSIGVTPEAAERRLGLGRALVTQVLSHLLPEGYGRYVAPLISRGNTSRGLMGAPPRPSREYALYEWRS